MIADQWDRGCRTSAEDLERQHDAFVVVAS